MISPYRLAASTSTLGQSWTGGLLLSDNAPPLDMVRVWNDRSWRIPIMSRLFGPMRGSAFVADLGGVRQNHPHARLIGYHVAAQPIPQLELGVAVIDAMGGRRRAGGDVLEPCARRDPRRRCVSHEVGFPVLEQNRRTRPTVADAAVAWIRVLCRSGAPTTLMDANSSEASWKTPAIWSARRFRVSSTAGASVSERSIIRPAFATTRTSTTRWRQRGLMFGDPLGPRGLGGYLTVDADAGRAGRFALSGAFEARSGNTYRSATTGPNDAGFHFELVSRRPSEKRSRLVATWAGWDAAPIGVQVAAGAEQVENFEFIGGASRTNWLARIAIVGRAR